MYVHPSFVCLARQMRRASSFGTYSRLHSDKRKRKHRCSLDNFIVSSETINIRRWNMPVFAFTPFFPVCASSRIFHLWQKTAPHSGRSKNEFSVGGFLGHFLNVKLVCLRSEMCMFTCGEIKNKRKKKLFPRAKVNSVTFYKFQR